jgi:hypothetical protein
VAPTEYDQIVYKAAAAIVNQAQQKDRRGLTADDIQQAEQVLESSGSQETWLQQAAEFTANHHISDKGWQGIISCFRQAFPICYPVLKRGESIPLKAECSPSLEKLCSIIPGAYQKTPEPEAPYSPSDSSIERSLQRLELEEGLKDVSELDQTFHFLFPAPPTSVHEIAISSSSLSSLEEDSELAEDPPPLREKPVYPSKFNRDLNPGITREQWKANRDADLAQWEEEKAAHQERVREYLHFNVPRANYSQVWQNYYNEDYPASERSAPASPVPVNPPVQPPTPEPRMANDERKRWLDRIDRITYDGTMDISRFLTSFDQYRSKLLTMDPPEEEEILFTFFQEALKNASAPPQRGVDGERYIGPATWLDRQPMSEVDTYEKLRDKLKAKFSRAETRNEDQVMRELQRMTFDMRKTTVKEFAEAWEEAIGSLELPKLLRMEKFMQKMPSKIQDEFQRQGNRPKWRTKTWEWLKEALIDADEEIRNPDPVFRRDLKDAQAKDPGRHGDNSKDPDESAKRERRMADEVARLKRENDQLKAETSQLREGSKRWANSDDALKPAGGSGFGSPLCWNCWERGHRADSCMPRRSNAERESIRIARGIPAPPEYTRRRAEYQEARKAQDKKSVAFIGSISDSGSEGGYDLSMSHVTSGEFTAAPAQGNDLPGSIYPQPRLRRREVESERWNVEPWLRAARVPVPLMELSKTEPFGSQIKRQLFSSPERPPPEQQDHDVEQDVLPPRRQEPLEESDGELEEEDRPRRNPGRIRRAPERFGFSSTAEQLWKIRNMSEAEFEEYVNTRQRPMSPAIKLAAWVGNLLFQDVLADIGADCNLMDMETALKIVACTPAVYLRTDRNNVTITGVAGKTNISGYIIVSIDLGQGVVAEDMVYVVERVFGGGQSKMLLGKPFLALIDAMIGVRHDYLCVPNVSGPPVIIKGRQYLGAGKWADHVFPKSTNANLCVGKGKVYNAGEERSAMDKPRSEEEDGNLRMHPWMGAYDLDEKRSFSVEAFCTSHSLTDEGLSSGWSGTEDISSGQFMTHILQALGPEPQDLAAFGVEGSIPIGASQALGSGFFAGYTEETAALEGLDPFVVDDVTWWVCVDGVTESQKLRLRNILQRFRPWVAQSLDEMRHCSPDLITHDLIPREGAVWQFAGRRKQFSPLEMTWIRSYLGKLLKASIISPIDTGMIEDDDGNKVPIQQTSHATLAPKPPAFRLCINYIYLNSQLYKHKWEIRNLEECVRKQAGHLRFSGIDGFSGFFVIPLGKGRHLTAFVVVGWGIFVWNYLPFGLQGGPSTYSRLIWEIFSSHVGENLQVYLDNVDFADGKRTLARDATGSISYHQPTESQAIDAQLDQLEFIIFPGFVRANMSVNPTKSPLLAKVRKTLGHVVSRAGMTKSPETVSKFKSILRQQVVKPEELERNLACLRYMSRYIPDLAHKTKFISDKLRGWKTYEDPPPGKKLPKGRKKMRVIKPGYEFIWTEDDQRKLLALSDELDLDITLQSFSEMLPIVMMFDASPWAISCVVGQLARDVGVSAIPVAPGPRLTVQAGETKGQDYLREAKPVMFLSKVLSDTQSRWSQPEREAFAIFWFITQNRHLVLGSKIYIYSDCKPITQAFQLSSTNAKVNGWILSLQEFDYEIFHIAGKTNVVADSLSRVPKELLLKMETEERRCIEKLHGVAKVRVERGDRPVVILKRGESLEALRGVVAEGKAGLEWEYEDASLGRCDMEHWEEWRRALVRFLRTGAFEKRVSKGERRRIIAMATNYRIEERTENHPARLVYKNRFEEYVPVPKNKEEIQVLLEGYHDEPCAGHYASEMTFRRIYRCFFWPTMRLDIHNYVKSCDRCQKARDLAEYPVEPLRPIVCLEPFEIIHVDYSGPYEPSAGKKYCLYIIDAFTGWLEVEACSRATGDMSIRLLEEYCKRFGFPQVIHSDHGPHFDNEQCRSWATASGIKWIFGSPGQAKGQGKVERSIRDVKKSIRKLADEQPKIWRKLLKDTQFAFNTRHPYSQYGDSPATLLFGYSPRNRVANLIQPGGTDRPEDRGAYVTSLQRLRLAKLDSIRNEAVTRQLDQWARRTEAYNQRLRRHRYEIGDLVLYQNYALKGKPGNPWEHRWKGPVTVVRISSKGKLDLQHPHGDIMKGWHTDKVRPYFLRV